jgi:hypothetical protein
MTGSAAKEARLADALQLPGAEVVLSDEILDRIDEIVRPNPDVGQLDMADDSPAVASPALRRRPIKGRTATEGRANLCCAGCVRLSDAM